MVNQANILIMKRLKMNLKKYEVLWDEYKGEELARIRLTHDKFNGIIYNYNTVSVIEEGDDDGGAVLKFDYDIVSSPEDINVESLTEEDHKEFEQLIGDILVGIITEAMESEDRTNNTGESNL